MRIQCPKCGQRFVVAEDFLGKTVECGSCDGRFKVTADKVISEKKKFYPGEKRDVHLEKFGSEAHQEASEVTFQPADYQQDFDVEQIGPPRPRKVLAILAGISFMVLVILIFLFGGGEDGPLRDIDTLNRFVLCGFSALLGGSLIVYGASQNRRLGLQVSLMLAVVLLTMPVFFPGNPVGVNAEPLVVANDTVEAEVDSSRQKLNDYLIEVGYEPVEDAIERYPKESVVGIYLRNAGALMRDKIATYLYNATGKLSRETMYQRGDDDNCGLMLLVEQQKSIDEIAALCTEFGRIEKIDKDLRLVDVVVERVKMTSLDKHKTLDPESLDFEAQNLKALRGIDPREKMDAVKRLANAEPRALREDISKRLIEMLPGSDSELQLEIIKALKTWALPDSGAEPVVLDAVGELHRQGKVSKPAMEFLVSRQVEGCEVILMDLWEQNPATWSDVMIQLGGGVEVLLLPKIKGMDTAHVKAACDILGKVGGKASLDYLGGLMSVMDEQKRKTLQAAIDEIKKRS